MDWGELYGLRDDPEESHKHWDDPSYTNVRSELMEWLVQKMMEAVDQSPHAERLA